MPDHGGQNSTRIAANTIVRGTVETAGDLLVEGRVEGPVLCGGVLRVAPSGACVGPLGARRAEVLGELLGNATCREAIRVAAGGRVVGDLRAPDVAIDGAATVDGRVDRLLPAPSPVPLSRLPVTASPVTASSSPIDASVAAGPPDADRAAGAPAAGPSVFDDRPPRGPASDATTVAGDDGRVIPRPPRPRGRVGFAQPATRATP